MQSRLTGDPLSWRRTRFKLIAYLSNLLGSNNVRFSRALKLVYFKVVKGLLSYDLSGLISQIRVKIPYYYGLTWSVIFSYIVINLWLCLLYLNLRVSTLGSFHVEPNCVSSLFCHMQCQCLSLENMLSLLKQFKAIKPPIFVLLSTVSPWLLGCLTSFNCKTLWF